VQDLAHVSGAAITGRALVMLAVAFAVCFITAKIIGKENKERWFKKRTNYTMLNRRGAFGEYINFGYPRTWMGLLVTFIMMLVIFGGGYLYMFVVPY
jgi:cytochrome b subunit of formate dehydrogenase